MPDNNKNNLHNIDTLNEELAYYRHKPIYSPADIFSINLFKATPLIFSYKRFMQHKWYRAHSIKHIRRICESVKTKNESDLLNLKNYLLLFGGEEVCTVDNYDEAKNILTRGQLWFGDRVTVAKGSYDETNQNIAHLWSFNENKTRIAVGFTLTPQGVWKKHSWLILQKRPYNKIVDSSDENYLYFGYVLTHSECNDFYWKNC